MQAAVHPSKEGTFTAYCGGKVTDACIDKASQQQQDDPETRQVCQSGTTRGGQSQALDPCTFL
jgi:hypothetical protein